MKKFFLILGIVLLLVVMGGVGAYSYFHYDSISQVEFQVEDMGEYYELGNGNIGMVFYPGGMVSPDAYFAFADQLAKYDIKVFVVKPLLDLAILDQNNISLIMENNPSIGKWYISGHSLGGTVMMMDVINNELQVDGAFFLGSYPVDYDKVAATEIPLVSIIGSNDLVVNRANYDEFISKLPVDEYVIDGGNHSGFGDYGLQRKDGLASLSHEDQIAETIRIMLRYIYPQQAQLGDALRQHMQEEFFVLVREHFWRNVTVVTSFNLVAVGDMVIHDPLIKHAWNGEVYDFSPSFTEVKRLIEKADYAICTMEAAMAGPATGFSGYPSFNVPDEFGDALKFAGFDGVNIVSNHTNDRGYGGFKRTREVLTEKELDILGAVSEVNPKRYTVVEKDDVRVGILSYGYETPPYNGMVTLNGVPMAKEFSDQVNTFNYDMLDRDLEEMKVIVDQMKEETHAQVLVMHWGNEYHQSPNIYQTKIAEVMTEAGIDVIVGSHPHVIQPIDWVTTENGKSLVFYSMGNFLSNQAVETLGENFTTSEDGTINDITLTFVNQELSEIEFEVEPTWVNRFATIDGRLKYEVLPVEDTLATFDQHELSDFIKYRLEKSHNNYLKIKNQSSTIKKWVKDI